MLMSLIGVGLCVFWRRRGDVVHEGDMPSGLATLFAGNVDEYHAGDDDFDGERRTIAERARHDDHYDDQHDDEPYEFNDDSWREPDDDGWPFADRDGPDDDPIADGESGDGSASGSPR
jgi:hypothetical protein